MRMAKQTAPPTVTPPVPDHDPMPLNGIDHVELYVGNALQAAYFYVHAFGFQRGRLRGPRDRRRATAPPTSSSRAASASCSPARWRSDSPIAAHQHKHGDGVKVDRPQRPRRRPRLPRGHRRAAPRASPSPTTSPTSTAPSASRRSAPTARRCTRSSSAAATTGAFLPGFAAVDDATEDSGMLLAHRPHRRQRRARHMDAWVKYYEDVFGMTRDDPLLRRRHRHRVLAR